MFLNVNKITNINDAKNVLCFLVCPFLVYYYPEKIAFGLYK